MNTSRNVPVAAAECLKSITANPKTLLGALEVTVYRQESDFLTVDPILDGCRMRTRILKMETTNDAFFCHYVSPNDLLEL
ncbi:unnamed protein product [Caenorhabditis sp. 36 PRJEB53466]|nr:unnamed protein product [Caenorhabditis sp. 36 PRJEB53466]